MSLDVVLLDTETRDIFASKDWLIKVMPVNLSYTALTLCIL